MAKERNYVDKFISEQLFEDFYFFNVGKEKCESRHSYGPDLREQYLIHYIVEGKGLFQTQGVSYTLSAGDFFLLRPNQLGYYEADDIEPWTYFWFGFDGSKAEDVLFMNGITKEDNVGHVAKTKEITQLFNEIFEANLFDTNDKLRIQGAFFRLFSNFTINEKIIVERNIAARNQRYSASFLMYIQNNYYHETLSISEIADSMNLNSSYLTQVIKEELKKTPIDYLTDYRIGKAKVLLSSSDLTIYDVAAKVGYKSSHSFSRVFKQKEQLTPSEYAKRYRN